MKYIVSVKPEHIEIFEEMRQKEKIIALYAPDFDDEYRFAIKCTEQELLIMKLHCPFSILTRNQYVRNHESRLKHLDTMTYEKSLGNY